MATELSIWYLFTQASFLVKGVMIILLLLSITSWTFIFQRWFVLKQARKHLAEFEERFWAGTELTTLFNALSVRRHVLNGLEHIFHSGFKEFSKLKSQPKVESVIAIENTARAMGVALVREAEKLELHLPFLATVGSISPYIGLFGTVWGIMHSFLALGEVKQATLAMVAPGIAEALIATAMGLFAAIPAVIAYNRYATLVEKVINQYENFKEEFTSILQRQILFSSQTGENKWSSL